MSEVYFRRFETDDMIDRIRSFKELINSAGIDFLSGGQKVGVKVHFGEPGCTTFVKPDFVKEVIDYIKLKGASPFLTDANTLYKGRRGTGQDHRKVAEEHGFGESELGAPIIIADGDDSSYVHEERINLKHFEKIKYGKAVLDADSLVVVSHVKGHMLCGFGGAIKNLGMGFGSRAAKQMMHADVKPHLSSTAKCTSCGTCISVCPADAVTMEGDYPKFDLEKCEGCAECIAFCPEGALRIQWDGSPISVMEKIAETAFAVVKQKRPNIMYYNFLTDVTPDCDCMTWSETPLVPDIGVLASYDPVAIDAASLHLIKMIEGRRDSKLNRGFEIGTDKFVALRPDIDGSKILDYGEEIGLGTSSFTLIDTSNG
jgi:uncharacterized Fe-S center protein